MGNTLETVCGTPQYVAPEVIQVHTVQAALDLAYCGRGLLTVASPHAAASCTHIKAVIDSWADCLQGTPGLIYGPAVDLWSVGIVLFILLGGAHSLRMQRPPYACTQAALQACNACPYLKRAAQANYMWLSTHIVNSMHATES